MCSVLNGARSKPRADNQPDDDEAAGADGCCGLDKAKVLPTAIYLDSSCLDTYLKGARAFGVGPFIISEYVLAEISRLDVPGYERRLLALESNGVAFLRAPPLTQIMADKFGPEWEGPIDAVELNVHAALAGGAHASAKLDALCGDLAAAFERRYDELRPQYADYLKRVKRGEKSLIDPRSPRNRRMLVEAAALQSLGLEVAPTAASPVKERIRWALRTWEMAMTFTRLDRQKNRVRDLRNDPIDAVHYVLAATFCAAIATSDRGMCRIRDVIPPPGFPFLEVAVDAGAVRVTPLV